MHDEDRGFLRGHAELREQRVGGRVGFQVQPPGRDPVPRHELAHAPDVRRIPRADDPHAAAEADQEGTTDEIGAQDEVAERGILGNQLPEPSGWHRQHFAGIGRRGGVEGALTGEQA